MDDGVERGTEGERSGDHFVPRTDAPGSQGNLHRVGARGEGKGVRRADVLGKAPLEFLCLGSRW